MFDVNIWELSVIGIVALLVFGPDKLPEVARTVGHWVGRARAYVNSIKSDIDREVQRRRALGGDELRRRVVEFHVGGARLEGDVAEFLDALPIAEVLHELAGVVGTAGHLEHRAGLGEVAFDAALDEGHLVGRLAGEELIGRILEHVADRAGELAGGELSQAFPEKLDSPIELAFVLIGNQTVHGAHESGLPAPGVAGEYDELAALHTHRRRSCHARGRTDHVTRAQGCLTGSRPGAVGRRCQPGILRGNCPDPPGRRFQQLRRWHPRRASADAISTAAGTGSAVGAGASGSQGHTSHSARRHRPRRRRHPRSYLDTDSSGLKSYNSLRSHFEKTHTVKNGMEELQRQDNRIKDVNDYLIFTSSKEQTQNIQSGRKLSNR